MHEDIDVRVVIRERLFVEVPELNDLFLAELLAFCFERFGERPCTCDDQANVVIRAGGEQLHHFDEKRDVLLRRDAAGIKKKQRIHRNAGTLGELLADRGRPSVRSELSDIDTARANVNAVPDGTRGAFSQRHVLLMNHFDRRGFSFAATEA
ncbi:MAG: hypothetical protein UZ17_ACD001000869 [Acidobacteria bacterium OLB17]|nr:MAG: hypothetical protein UZ17_ACD001000869 [Acidobacteria bacterium OLB17]